MSDHAPEIEDLLAHLNPEQINEVGTIVAEIMERASGYLERGRSSMPIEIDSALILVAIAAHAVQRPAECGARIATAHPRVSQACVLPVLHEGDHSPATTEADDA